MDVSMDIHVKSADMDAKFYIHGKPGFCNFFTVIFWQPYSYDVLPPKDVPFGGYVDN